MNRRHNYQASAALLRPKRVKSIASLITPFAERVFNDEINYISSRVGARRLTRTIHAKILTCSINLVPPMFVFFTSSLPSREKLSTRENKIAA